MHHLLLCMNVMLDDSLNSFVQASLGCEERLGAKKLKTKI